MATIYKRRKKRQGPAIYLCLKGEAREAVRSIDVEEILKDDGVETIVQTLDEIFLKDETTHAFCAFGDFVEYHRGSGESYTKFILEFEKRYREVKKYDLTLNDKVQAYFLLKAANLSDDHERLVRTTSVLKYKDMKEQLQKIFGEFSDDKGGSGVLPVKREDCFYNGSFNHFHSSVISEEEIAVNFRENQLSEEEAEETRDNLEPMMVSEEIVMGSEEIVMV